MSLTTTTRRIVSTAAAQPDPGFWPIGRSGEESAPNRRRLPHSTWWPWTAWSLVRSDQAGLADPGLAGHQQRARAARGGVAQERVQLVTLRGPTYVSAPRRHTQHCAPETSAVCR